jgi:Zn-dependent alcohol dehydrogenase
MKTVESPEEKVAEMNSAVTESTKPKKAPAKTMMRAARLGTDGIVRIEDVPILMPGPGEALVRILQAGICNTDIEIANRG